MSLDTIDLVLKSKFTRATAATACFGLAVWCGFAVKSALSDLENASLPANTFAHVQDHELATLPTYNQRDAVLAGSIMTAILATLGLGTAAAGAGLALSLRGKHPDDPTPSP